MSPLRRSPCFKVSSPLLAVMMILKFLLLVELAADVVAWEKATYLKDTKGCFRLVRNLRRSKKNIKAHHIATLYTTLYTATPVDLTTFDDFDKAYTEKLELPGNQLARLQKNGEVEIYVRALLVIYLIKKKKNVEVRTFLSGFAPPNIPSTRQRSCASAP